MMVDCFKMLETFGFDGHLAVSLRLVILRRISEPMGSWTGIKVKSGAIV